MTRKNDAAHEPTELEAAVLGAIWEDGPCTAYAIRKRFLISPSPRWSGSAGAIYPLLRRMEDLALVLSRPTPGARRNQRDYAITRSGLSVLRRWLRQVDPSKDAGLIHDPLRLKILFLDILSEKQALELIENSIRELKVQLKPLQADCENKPLSESRAAHFAASNALLVTQARLVWLEEVLFELRK